MATAVSKKLWALLRKTHLLNHGSNEEVENLVKSPELNTFRARQVIYLPGDRSVGVHFLIQGRVKVSKVTRDGKELTLAYRTEGDFFGDGCLVTRGPREEMAEAMEPSSSIEVPWESLLALVDSNPQVASFLARVTLIRQRDLESKFEQLIFKDVGAKLAELLLELGTRHGVVAQGGLELALKITHQELANLIGSTRETVSLTLSQFKRKGYITTEGRRVILANQDGLRSLG